MRSSPFILAAAAAIGVASLVSPAAAFTSTAPAAIEAAADQVGVTDTVHCRSFRHGHRYGHRGGRGCEVGVIVTPRRSTDVYIRRGSRTVIRDRDRDSTSVRSRTTIRSGEGTNVRGSTTIRTREGSSDTNIRARSGGGSQGGGDVNVRSRGSSEGTTGAGRQGGGNSGGRDGGSSSGGASGSGGTTIEKRQPGQ